ncbi:MAG: efflux RND transporter permease subunit [Methylotenera sp.]|nr:efflux RND transporter permease subunit [Methylotenera sp.]HPH07967.1 efflux RND transporter permease subunit [Methylotenera sp.]HPM49667.1 efflux RND transporter permease subunit [Methylotenera sp.]
MTLPELSIKRHVLAWMISGLLVLFGLIAYGRIGIDRMPNVELPVISVSTTLRGANPEIMDTSVTNLIESAVNTTPGIEHIQSTSSPGFSNVTITFALEKNIDVAFNEVQSKVNQTLRRLPDDADPPVVQKLETNAQPIMWLALHGDRTVQQLNLYAQNVIKKKLENINGVGEVRLGGRRDRTIRVNLNPDRMAAYKITAGDLTTAFQKEHIQLPGGFLVGSHAEQLLKLDLEFHDLKSLAELVISYKSGAPIRLKDVAEIEDGLTDNRQVARFNGKPTIGLGIVKISNANTVAIIDAVNQKLNEDIRPNLPPGLTLDISTNDADFIHEMVQTLQDHLVEGTLFAALIVLIFMRSFSSTLMICLEIPVSLFGAIAVMYFAGYTFNSMTLLALLLLIGIVVDDAIVVRESILRHMSGEIGTALPLADQNNPQAIRRFRTQATINGSQEVVFAVLASTAALVCIFAPVIFMEGMMGKFFKSFAVVVTFGVLVSLLVSLTLTPMLCAHYLKVQPKQNKIYLSLGRFFNHMDLAYHNLLTVVLYHRWLVLVVTLLVVLSSAYFLKNLDKDFVPEMDEGRFMVNIKTPLGSNLNYTESRLKLIEDALAPHRDQIASYFAAIGMGSQGQVNQGMMFVTLKPKEMRSMKQQDIIKSLRKKFDEIPGVRAAPSAISIVRGQRSEKLQFNLTGPNLQQVGALSLALQQKLNETPGMGKVDLDMQLDLPQYVMHVDRVRAASLGITSSDIANAITVFTGGLDIAEYNDAISDGQRYKIRLKAKDSDFSQIADVNKIYLRTKSGELTRLDSVVTFKQELGAAVIGRYDLQYAANLYSNPSMPLGEASQKVDEAAKNLLPAGYRIGLTGQALEMQKTVKNTAFIFILAFVLLYMVLASQFNSFIQPMIVMLAQPLAIIGGLFALWLTNHSLNIYSMIGLVLLIGLVAKNSILLVDLTNQLREKGTGINEALLEACPVRLRPVIMTSLTLILALFPAALGLGAGAETNGPLAVAVIGGMISSTLLTLVVVPAAYSLVMHGVARFEARSNQPAKSIA